MIEYSVKPFSDGDYQHFINLHSQLTTALYEFDIMCEHMQDQINQGYGTDEQRIKVRKLMRDF